MRQNSVRKKLAAGETVMGMMHFSSSPMLVEVMASAGLDFFIIDFEHSPTDLSMAAHLVRAGDAAGIAPLVRVPDVDPPLVKKMLDLGVQGIVLPHGTRKSCEALLDAVRYEPRGSRGSCPAIRQANYGQPSSWKTFQDEADREIVVIPLIESPATLDEMEALAAMDGLDVFFLGPFDFSVASGIPGAGFDHPRMAEAIDRMIAITRKHGKYVMTSVGDRIDPKLGRSLLDRGVRMISYSADALVFRNACLDIARLKRPA
jgi:2-keto-3-deoxy-L-rhamnonate aldolase RhmA